MMAVCGWEPQLHVPNGMKGWTRTLQSSIGSAKMLGSPLNALQKLLNHLPDGDWKCDHGYDVEWGCKACSRQAGHATSSMPTQGSRANYCPVVQQIQLVYTAQLIFWCRSTGKTTRWCHGCWRASKTCSWLKQAPWRCRCCRRWTNILVHLPIINHDRGVLLLVGEGVKYHISYFKDIYA